MKKLFPTSFIAFVTIFVTFAASARKSAPNEVVEFGKVFQDSTLRVDYIFGGGPQGISIMLDAQSKAPGWAGRRVNLDKKLIDGNGEIQVLDPLTGKLLYVNTFSTLFHEWLEEDEARTTQRAFENCYQLPLPKGEADIRIVLRNNRREEIASMTYRYDPADELVAIRNSKPLPHKYLHRGADPDQAIDIAILAEGYTEAEMDSFLIHAKASADEILSYEPFSSMKDKLNFVAVMSPSKESGVSVPLDGDWKETALGAHFSTFHSPRYLTTPNLRRVYDALTGIPFEHIMIVVNTDRYGGGGIYNSYHIAAAKNEKTLPVTVHEFGHSFAGLADEYFYLGDDSSLYPLDIEPWEPNITTLVDFDSKWKDLLPADTPIPTPWASDAATRDDAHRQAALRSPSAPEANEGIGVYEGGGYRENGVYRPVITCRMRDNYHPTFCPVCRRAIARTILFSL